MLWLGAYRTIDQRQLERGNAMSVNWIPIIVGSVSVAVLLVLLVGAGLLFWLLRRAGSKKA